MDKDKEQEYLHEAVDRVHIVSSHLQMALGEHDVTKTYKDIEEAYEKAVEQMEELYQLIGQKIN